VSGEGQARPERPHIVERRAYAPNLPVEEFMLPVLEAAIRTVLDDLPRGPQFRVLDAGCGGQPFRFVFETNSNSYSSCDASDPLGVVDHIAELDRELPRDLLGEQPFDFILCSEVLEHVLDWDTAFANLARLLAPNGRLLVTSPFVYVLHEQPYDFWRVTPHGIRALAERHQLSVVQLDSIGGSWDVIGTVLGAAIGSARARDPSLTTRAMTRVTEAFIRRAFAVLRKRTLQQRIHLGDLGLPIYLANVALLEKRTT
jgi:SAM-dependent methyltransferase